MSQNLDIYKIYNDENNKIRIYMNNTGDIVEGCVIQDTSLSASVQWGDPMSQLMQEAKSAMINKLGEKSQWLGKAADILGKISPVQVNPVVTTLKQWLASSGPSLTLNLLFLALKPSDDVRKPINKLMKGVFPSFHGLDSLMSAPNNYMIGSLSGGMDTTPNGVLSVYIGKWFAAKQIMLITNSASPTYSKETIKSGLPLWASIGVTFEPYRAISYDDWLSFFP